jgi:hypothetical protein
MTDRPFFMPKLSLLVSALVLQVAAQALGGVWGAAVGGLLVGLAWRRPGAFRTAFLAAAAAAALLLAMTAVRGAPLLGWADRLGANFSVPGWGLLALTVLLPALQAGGLAGGVARIAGRSRTAVATVAGHGEERP